MAAKEIKRADLISAIDAAKPAIDANSYIEQSGHYIFIDGHVVAANERMGIAVPVDTGQELTVPAKDFRAVLTGMPDASLSLSAVAGKGKKAVPKLKIASTTTTASLPYMGISSAVEDLVDGVGILAIKDNEWKKLPKDFNEGMGLCSISVSRDVTDRAFNSVLVTSESAISTDEIRVSRFAWDEPFAKRVELLLPLEAVKEIIRMEPAEYVFGSTWAFFRNSEGVVLAAPNVVAEFPECDKYLEVEGDTVELPSTIKDALKAVKVFASGDSPESKFAYMAFSKGEVMLRARNQRGQIERTLAVPGLKSVRVKEVLVNPNHLLDMIDHASIMTYDDSRALLTHGNLEHVMMLPADDSEDEGPRSRRDQPADDEGGDEE